MTSSDQPPVLETRISSSNPSLDVPKTGLTSLQHFAVQSGLSDSLVCSQAFQTCTSPGADKSTSDWRQAEGVLLALFTYLYIAGEIAHTAIRSRQLAPDAHQALWDQADLKVRSSDPTVYSLPSSTFSSATCSWFATTLQSISSAADDPFELSHITSIMNQFILHGMGSAYPGKEYGLVLSVKAVERCMQILDLKPSAPVETVPGGPRWIAHSLKSEHAVNGVFLDVGDVFVLPAKPDAPLSVVDIVQSRVKGTSYVVVDQAGTEVALTQSDLQGATILDPEDETFIHDHDLVPKTN